MNETLTQSIWITLLGIGLVFVVLLLLAGLMSLMTRMFRERMTIPQSRATEAVSEDDGKARAAALAVAVALAEQAQSTARPINPPQPTIIGAWQLGMRTRQMTDKSKLMRGKRG